MIPSAEELADAYRRMMEQTFVQKQIDKLLDEIQEDGKEATVPDDLADQIEKYLNEKPEMSWDQAMKNIVLADSNGTDS